ncbi:twin transmembrane helix small protein [Alloalcanivorax gelatiniphagus]|uniref:Twin transmembrane helix small protein n=1 Tax=Alloalcanivorax gelatiniphagus TaxID=1194167 RepID=A0ABY2XLL3_9GAMM|nr:twin transmembrane helix small protein [Alloalcanivorax gelatiniphagus]TMW12148.1 twin transmembrane helix small protein [Alloalcanivorax gelatiniphagus]|tara:strand:- start:2155 stop:2406 length:252 start_codon:yes stop_codon:yes gene_type:complete
MWWVKLIVIVLLIAAVVALGKALMSLVRGQGKDGKTMRALAWRVGFSVAVFLFILLSMMMGWIEPHGVNPAASPDAPMEQSAE